MIAFIGGSLIDFQAAVWANTCGLQANTRTMEADFGDCRPGPERPRQIAAAT
jgi:hypothetical protein